MTEDSREQLRNKAQCRRCRYLLRDLPENRCPECGQEFDLSDPVTFHVPGQAWWEKLGNKPTLAGTVVFILLTLRNLWDISCPGDAIDWGIFTVWCIWAPLWLALIIPYVVRLSLLANIAYHQPSTEPVKLTRNERLRWMIVPVCVLITFTSLAYPWPMYFRFMLSQNAFDNARKQCNAGTFTGKQWVGLYYVDSFEYFSNSGEAWFEVGWDLIDPVGFEYRTTGPNYPDEESVAFNWYIVQH